jgi:hypothetical protein
LRVLYGVVVADLVVAVCMLGYARVRERRNRPGVIAVGVMLVVCAATLVVVAVAHRLPARGSPGMADPDRRYGRVSPR